MGRHGCSEAVRVYLKELRCLDAAVLSLLALLVFEYTSKSSAAWTRRYSVYLLYWYKCTNTDAKGADRTAALLFAVHAAGAALWMAPGTRVQRLLSQYLYLCTSKASKLSSAACAGSRVQRRIAHIDAAHAPVFVRVYQQSK
jgi:hypothetical protein